MNEGGIFYILFMYYIAISSATCGFILFFVKQDSKLSGGKSLAWEEEWTWTLLCGFAIQISDIVIY